MKEGVSGKDKSAGGRSRKEEGRRSRSRREKQEGGRKGGAGGRSRKEGCSPPGGGVQEPHMGGGGFLAAEILVHLLLLSRLLWSGALHPSPLSASSPFPPPGPFFFFSILSIICGLPRSHPLPPTCLFLCAVARLAPRLNVWARAGCMGPWQRPLACG